MSGFKKYIIIIGVTFMMLWLISIVVYWDTIGEYVAQRVGGLLDLGASILIAFIFIGILISLVFSMFRG